MPGAAPPPSLPASTEAELPPVRPTGFDAGQATAVVRYLAGDIGPRPGTSPAFDQAADWTAGYLTRLGYRVERQRFAVPAGTSWGVPVAAGVSVNLIATTPDFRPTRPHLVVGAHLDTVPQAPGAEDNASGIGVLLAAADVASRARTRLPVAWVVFGAEEPRGTTDDDHHYGSRTYVAAMSDPQRRALRGMVSLDRVGVGDRVPVGSSGEGDAVQRALLAAADRVRVPASPERFQRSSDHWSFVRVGLPAARLGSTPYAGYHSARDVPSVVGEAQLDRVGRLLLAWLEPSA
jgi:aminopeptidase YwaD